MRALEAIQPDFVRQPRPEGGRAWDGLVAPPFYWRSPEWLSPPPTLMAFRDWPTDGDRFAGQGAVARTDGRLSTGDAVFGVSA